MRRIKGTYILIPLFCTLLCTGCDKEEDTLQPTQAIGFSTSVDGNDTQAGTRAEATTENLKEIGVFAYNTGTSDFDPSASSANLMNNQSVKKENGTWTYSPVKFWPASPNDKVSFFAYAPHTSAASGVSIAAPTSATRTGKPYIAYTPGTEEIDLLLSTGVMNCTNSYGPVQFTMKHALAKVIFKVKMESGASKTITGISTECPNKGGYRTNNTYNEIVFVYNSTQKITRAATINVTADGTAKTVKEFLLPPKHMTDTKITLTYSDGSTSKTVEATLPNPTDNDWISGKAISYTLTLRDNQTLDIAVEADMAWETQVKPDAKDGRYNYIIKTAEDLAKFAEAVYRGESDAIAIQVADIDLQDLKKSSNTSYQRLADDWIPIGATKDHAFTGIYNGNGHTISNLKITGVAYDQGGYAVGLFGFTRGARLVGIHLPNVDVSVQHLIRSTGTLVGEAENATYITCCSVIGQIRKIPCYYNDTDGTILATGGLIGSAADALISFCHANVAIGGEGLYAPKMATEGYMSCVVGGLIGYISSQSSIPGCNIAACHASGNIMMMTLNARIAHTINVGGFLGSDNSNSKCRGEIIGSYSSGRINIAFSDSPESNTPRVLNAGGFAGFSYSTNYMSCYSYVPLHLSYATAIWGSSIGDFYLGGFIGNMRYPTLYKCYGHGQTMPDPNLFGNQSSFHSDEFTPSSDGSLKDCYSYTTLSGKTVQEIMSPSSVQKSSLNFWFIDYYPPTNTYYLGNTTKPWNSKDFWKQSPADPAHPEINYDILNVNP